ncbi:dicarboxylate/amino acid:cation symporter, partial [bacterium]|nr:dicarboxylate/amino acid:cation symporter [bacterium]
MKHTGRTKDKRKGGDKDLQWKILIGIAAGLILGLLFNRTAYASEMPAWMVVLKTVLHYVGDVFIRLLRMTIIPLVFASLFTSVVRLGDIRRLKRIGAVAMAYYLATTILAVLLGMLLVNAIHPGKGVDPEAIRKLDMQASVPESIAGAGADGRHPALILMDTLIDMVPKNPVAAMAGGDILQLIFFTIFFAVVTSLVGRRARPLIQVVEGLDHVMGRFILLIMRIAPVCLFALVTVIMADLGFSVLGALGKYALTVLAGLGIHAAVTLPVLTAVFGRTNPISLFRAVLPALLTAWSTASSAAALPLTLDCTEKRAGV